MCPLSGLTRRCCNAFSWPRCRILHYPENTLVKYQVLPKWVESEWPNGLRRCSACCTDGHGFEPSPMLVDKWSASVCMEKVWLPFWLPPWLWNSEQMSPEVQNRGISGPTKRTCGLQKKFWKKALPNLKYKLLLRTFLNYLQYRLKCCYDNSFLFENTALKSSWKRETGEAIKQLLDFIAE